MIIDASLGRSGCCGFPSCPSGGGSQQPPMPPVCSCEPDALNVILTTAQTAVASGSVVPLSGNVRQIGDGLAFDAANHAVIVNESGVYLFNWHVLVQATAADQDVVLTLQTLDGMNVLGATGAIAVPEADDAVLISGTAVARLQAGTSVALVVNSTAAVNIPVAGTAPAAFAASLTVTEVSGTPSQQNPMQNQNGMRPSGSCGSGFQPGFQNGCCGSGFQNGNGGSSFPNQFPSPI